MGIWTGWVCHDRAFSDGMPVWNEAKDICIIFSGENVIDVEEVTQLKSKGHKPGTQAASCLVHLYEEDGEGFLQKLNGWFSGVCIDLRQRTVFVFNDRYGLNHMYYHEKNGVFYFASEAKCLLKILPELRHLHLPSFA
jgi:asparagine synthase (glutamine-hydrolysing)